MLEHTLFFVFEKSWTCVCQLILTQTSMEMPNIEHCGMSNATHYHRGNAYHHITVCVTMWPAIHRTCQVIWLLAQSWVGSLSPAIVLKLCPQTAERIANVGLLLEIIPRPDQADISWHVACRNLETPWNCLLHVPCLKKKRVWLGNSQTLFQQCLTLWRCDIDLHFVQLNTLKKSQENPAFYILLL